MPRTSFLMAQAASERGYRNRESQTKQDILAALKAAVAYSGQRSAQRFQGEQATADREARTAEAAAGREFQSSEAAVGRESQSEQQKALWEHQAAMGDQQSRRDSLRFIAEKTASQDPTAEYQMGYSVDEHGNLVVTQPDVSGLMERRAASGQTSDVIAGTYALKGASAIIGEVKSGGFAKKLDLRRLLPMLRRASLVVKPENKAAFLDSYAMAIDSELQKREQSAELYDAGKWSEIRRQAAAIVGYTPKNLRTVGAGDYAADFGKNILLGPIGMYNEAKKMYRAGEYIDDRAYNTPGL